MLCGRRLSLETKKYFKSVLELCDTGDPAWESHMMLQKTKGKSHIIKTEEAMKNVAYLVKAMNNKTIGNVWYKRFSKAKAATGWWCGQLVIYFVEKAKS